MTVASSARLHTNYVSRFADLGVEIIPHAVVPTDVIAMDAVFPELQPRTPGARCNAFTRDAQDWFAKHNGLIDLASILAQEPVRLSRMQAFDKSPMTNWFVPWHQDRVEDGQERPITALERTVALRIHLDDCKEDSGPLEVIPGSHKQARLNADAIAKLVAEVQPLVCIAGSGDIVAMRPLLVHRSQRARKPAARRVIHLEFTAA
jgi:ectoine hydroxylase-related dioxygenase (phytanoyl-CoA dioxygenase family)